MRPSSREQSVRIVVIGVDVGVDVLILGEVGVWIVGVDSRILSVNVLIRVRMDFIKCIVRVCYE